MKKVLLALLALAVVVGGYFSFFHKSEQADKTVTVGIMSGSKQDDAIWQNVAKTAKEEYGIDLEFKRFTDYSQPNKALADGDIDINAFQNYPFLEEWNKANDTNIVAIGDTFISPMRVFSQNIDSLDDLKDGDTIAVPNDATNETRALKVLASSGIIEVNDNELLTIKDITANPKNLTIKEVDASQTAQALSSVAASVINVNYAVTAGLDLESAIYVEPTTGEDAKPYYNFIAANQEDADNELYKNIVKSYQTDKTKEIMKEQYGVAQLPVW